MLDADWNEVGEYEKLSDYWQIGTAVFADARLKGERTQEQLAALYRMLFDEMCIRDRDDTAGMGKEYNIGLCCRD